MWFNSSKLMRDLDTISNLEIGKPFIGEYYTIERLNPEEILILINRDEEKVTISNATFLIKVMFNLKGVAVTFINFKGFWEVWQKTVIEKILNSLDVECFVFIKDSTCYLLPTKVKVALDKYNYRFIYYSMFVKSISICLDVFNTILYPQWIPCRLENKNKYLDEIELEADKLLKEKAKSIKQDWEYYLKVTI